MLKDKAAEEVKIIDNDLLRRIDNLQLSQRLTCWKEARFNARVKVCSDRARLAMESWRKTESEDIEIRRAKLLKNILEGINISIYEFDLIVGRVTDHLLGATASMDLKGDCVPGLMQDGDIHAGGVLTGVLSSEDREVLKECTRFFVGKTAPDHSIEAWHSLVGTWAQDYHNAKGYDPDLSVGDFPGVLGRPLWEKLLAGGLRGTIEEAELKIRKFLETGDTDLEKYNFWQASIIVCEALINHAHRYAELARRMAGEEKNPQRQNELSEMAEVCDWVPENPARSFHEAIQFINFVAITNTLEQSFGQSMIGRADQYLLPFFQQDLRNGKLTLDKAADLLGGGIASWGSLVNIPGEGFSQTHQASYAAHNINLGGVDRKGRDASNELSYFILHIVGLLKLPEPHIGFRWHPGTPRWLLLKALETNTKVKGGIPLFQNDTYVINNLVDDGIALEEARDWYGYGCVLPVVPGKIEHYGSAGLGSINIALILDLTLHNGVSQLTGKKLGLETGDPRSFKSFNDLYEAFKKQHEFIVKRILWLGMIAGEVQQKYVRLPFTSCVAPGCMEKGRDVLCTDADNHLITVSDRALVDTADSLTAIKQLVFDLNKLTMRELMEALDSDFEGSRGEEIRQWCLAAPKFGNDIDMADWMVRDVGSFSGSVIHSFKNKYTRIRIIRDGLSWHYFGGKGVGALPNGRKAWEPLNDGSLSPMRGMDKSGPTAVLRSVLKADFKESSMSVLNQKFSGTIMQSPESREKLALLTDTFMRSGGQHVQYNIVDTQELREAQKNPEKYRDLVVRVGGFSVYFVDICTEVQDDIIARSEHGL
jgi:pyruvate formate-lyase/glycerol dehydratase family glycyl radical enzyme